MGMRALALTMVALWSMTGCAQAPAQEGDAEAVELSPEQKSLVLEQAPTDIPTPRYIDFNSKAELLGYSLSPAALAAPGSKVTLKLYWRSVSKLEQGYELFTQLVTPGGKRFDVQATGALRQGGALAPSNWEPGKVYVDETELTVPDDLEAASFSIVVGFKTAPIAPEAPADAEPAEAGKKADKAAEKAEAASFSPIYLNVLSGAADNKFGGVVATLATGVTPGAKRVRAAKDDKRGVKRPPIKAPLRPREPGARPAPPTKPAQ
jgi:hypothetical protein